MAINPNDLYPNGTAAPDAEYPYGKARNVSVPGAPDGTPWEQALINDLFGMQQALLEDAGIVPSGDPDHVGASQYLQAMKTLASSAGAGVEVGQATLQIAAQPLQSNYLRLDGGAHSKASYPDIEAFFPTALSWSTGGVTSQSASGLPVGIDGYRDQAHLDEDNDTAYILARDTSTNDRYIVLVQLSTGSFLQSKALADYAGYSGNGVPAALVGDSDNLYVGLIADPGGQKPVLIVRKSDLTEVTYAYDWSDTTVDEGDALALRNGFLYIIDSGQGGNSEAVELDTSDLTKSNAIRSLSIPGANDVAVFGSTVAFLDVLEDVVLYDADDFSNSTEISMKSQLVLSNTDFSECRAFGGGGSKLAIYFEGASDIYLGVLDASDIDYTTGQINDFAESSGLGTGDTSRFCSVSPDGSSIVLSSDTAESIEFYRLEDFSQQQSLPLEVNYFDFSDGGPYAVSLTNTSADPRIFQPSGDASEFILPDVASPDNVFEYRIRAL